MSAPSVGKLSHSILAKPAINRWGRERRAGKPPAADSDATPVPTHGRNRPGNRDG